MIFPNIELYLILFYNYVWGTYSLISHHLPHPSIFFWVRFLPAGALRFFLRFQLRVKTKLKSSKSARLPVKENCQKELITDESLGKREHRGCGDDIGSSLQFMPKLYWLSLISLKTSECLSPRASLPEQDKMIKLWNQTWSCPIFYNKKY